MNTADSALPALDVPAAPVVCAQTGWAVIDVTGADAVAFLQGQLSSDVRALAPGEGQYWSYNSPKGRMLANGVLWRPPGGTTDRIVVVVSADLAESFSRRLAMFVLRAKVAVRDGRHERSLIGVAGGDAVQAVRSALGVECSPLTAVRFADDASALMLPDGRIVVHSPAAGAALTHAALARHAATGDADLWRWFGIAAGVPVITAATTDLFVPQAANWDALGGVSFRKGCYPGQEIVARMQYLGRLKERLHAFGTDDEPPASGVRVYSAAFGDGQACGTVVNAAPGASGGSVMLAVVQAAAVEADDLRLGAPDGPAMTRLSLPYALPDAPVTPRAPRIA
ncbi:MAG: folate-binding protein [Betaproteobacteria bacterium]